MLARPTRSVSSEVAPETRADTLVDIAARCSVRSYRAGQLVRAEGQEPDSLLIVLSGWAQQHAQLSDGRRQIVAVHLPGEICCPDSLADTRADCTLAALSALRLGRIPSADVRALLIARPDIAHEIAASQRRQAAIQRCWMMCLGQCNALERIAHLMCELYVRQRIAGEAIEDTCPFRLTQVQVAEICGVTQVHANRTIQELRRRDLVDLAQKKLVIRDFDALAAVAMFDGKYLEYHAPPNAKRRDPVMVDKARPLGEARIGSVT